jgi:MFS family permease
VAGRVRTAVDGRRDSRFGDALRGAALPLFAVGLTDLPVLLSLVTAAGYVPWIVFGLFGGAVADRVDQRRTMWAVDAARGALMAAFALAVWLRGAGIGLLLVLAFALTPLPPRPPGRGGCQR